MLVFATGCGSGGGAGRHAVEGKVSFDGQPVTDGQIMFEPTGQGLPMVAGKIEEGLYKVDAEHGPAPGSYRVRIEGYRKKKVPGLSKHPYLGDQQEAGVVREQYLPAQFNSSTTLNAEITSEKSEYNFDLVGKR